MATKFNSLAVLAAAAAIVTAAVSAAGAQEVRFKATSFLPTNQSFGLYFKRWTDAVNERGKGLVQIDTLGPEAIPTLEQTNAIKNGVTQMAFHAATYYTGVMWEGEVQPLSEKPMKELRANGAWAYLDKIHREKMNAVLLGQLGDGVKMFVYTTRSAKTENADKPMDGLTLRSVPLFKPFFESLGARTVTMPPGEVFTALERNIVQGYGWPLWGIKDAGWLPVTKFRYGPGFLGANTPILVNLDAWNKLNDAQRKFLNDMAVWLDDEWIKWRDERNAEENRIQSEAGVKYVDMGPAFSKRANDARWSELEQRSPAHVAHLRKLLSN